MVSVDVVLVCGYSVEGRNYFLVRFGLSLFVISVVVWFAVFLFVISVVVWFAVFLFVFVFLWLFNVYICMEKSIV